MKKNKVKDENLKLFIYAIYKHEFYIRNKPRLVNNRYFRNVQKPVHGI